MGQKKCGRLLEARNTKGNDSPPETSENNAVLLTSGFYFAPLNY